MPQGQVLLKAYTLDMANSRDYLWVYKLIIKRLHFFHK